MLGRYFKSDFIWLGVYDVSKDSCSFWEVRCMFEYLLYSLISNTLLFWMPFVKWSRKYN